MQKNYQLQQKKIQLNSDTHYAKKQKEVKMAGKKINKQNDKRHNVLA